jgi:thiamine pyrophosphate-dependent acetolactate synthase large subunit-like protein
LSDAARKGPRCGSGHPHYIGTYAADAPYPRGQADLVMQVGARDWGGTAIPTASRLPQGAKFVALGLDTAMLGRTQPLDLAVVGDVKAAMRDLIDAIKSMATADLLVRIREGRAATVRAAVADMRKNLMASVRANYGQSPIHPDELAYEMEQVLDHDAIIVQESQAAGSEIKAALKRGIQATRDGNPYLVDVVIARFGGGAESTWHQNYKLAAERTKQV